MNRVKRFLNIKDIIPGMIAAEDIKSNNILLVAEGKEIKAETISTLMEKYAETILAVYLEEEGISETSQSKTMAQVDEIFQEYSYEMKDMFNEIGYTGKANIDDVRNFVKKIQKHLDSPSIIIKNIVLYGSGNDRIYRHSVNVAALSTLLGKWIGLDDNQINLINYSSILHDYGKTKIDKGVLNKSGKLTESEWKTIKSHPIIGYEIVKQIQFLDSSVSYGVLMHHERCDGSGYPLGISGEKIHAFGKIIAIADTFEAISSNKNHKANSDPFSALEEIKKESLLKLDYEYTKIFVEHIVNYYMGENARMNDGRVCKIIQVDPNDILRPLVLDGSTFIDLKKEKNLRVESLVF
ncbi:cyclic di-GMP phosphodiesterase response regulator RpfG [Clostridium oryzae]|uniref:Cyclic di-GMP phosphodiesterase response regulator RpfG n=1 Tax=Clostridium oryzae TaxID=1450648 RepID=A0A1V4IKF4_9CLOT|nr:cyclic di-GMP phosphodiesterase response regulator RpfG [Clostridium oryzae]